ncbi:nucleotidyltransferase family protein [Emcibacter sp. SYSU 3D8]|uniref:nucleotidyltransferase family protein n=1 Tax=Emcibacter sp. SYSU 3D8 TaxID=3133969 RepID=UPI0031FEF70F
MCRCLSVDDSANAVAELRASLPRLDDAAGWAGLVQTADADMLAPALRLALARKGLDDAMPAQVRAQLHRRYTMNALLNERIREDALHVTALCERLGIAPVVLKGGAYLFEAPPEMLGGRSMRDLDFLLPADQVDTVVDAMLDQGYMVKDEADDDTTYTHPALQRPGGVVAVELHHRVGQQRSLLSADMAWRDIRTLQTEPRLRVLSPTHRVWHNIFHSQVQDQGHSTGLIWLRQLADLVDICRRHGESIDWAALDQMMTDAGMDGVMRARLLQAERLLGLPWPLRAPPGPAARLRLHRASLLLKAPRTMAVTRMWAALMAPFKLHRMDLLYHCGTGHPVKLAKARLRHIRQVARKYRGNLLGRLWQRRQYDV